MLEGGSNYEYNSEGQIVIKSSGKFLKNGSPRSVVIQDENGNTNVFESIKSSAIYLGRSHQTVLRRLRDGKPLKWNSMLIYIKPNKE